MKLCRFIQMISQKPLKYSSPRAAAVLWQGTIVQKLTTPTIGLNRKYNP
jgi:hypothetical protein